MQENSGLLRAVTWPLVMMFGAVGDMLGTGAAIIIAQSRGCTVAGTVSLGNMLVWQVLFSLLMMTVVKCFLTDIPSVRRYRRTDARRRALFADFDTAIWLMLRNRRAGGNP